jgi:hypothetical protein
VITLERCRELFGVPNAPDEQVARMRDEMYEIARVIVKTLRKQGLRERPNACKIERA